MPVEQHDGQGPLAGIGSGVQARCHAEAGEDLAIAHVLAASYPDGDPYVGLIQGNAAPAFAVQLPDDGLLYRLEPGAALLPAYWNCSASA